MAEKTNTVPPLKEILDCRVDIHNSNPGSLSLSLMHMHTLSTSLPCDNDRLLWAQVL